MVRRLLFLLSVLFLLGGQAIAQEDHPVFRHALSLGARGVPAAKAPATSPGKFKPTTASRPGIELWLKTLEVAEKDKKEATKNLIEAIATFEEEAKKSGNDHDVAYAYACSTAVLYALAAEKAIDDKELMSLVASFKSAFDIPLVRNAKDIDKQEASEFAIGMMQVLLASLGTAQTQEQIQKIRKTATDAFPLLIGAKISQVKVEAGTVTIEGSAPKTTGAMAPGFTFTKPSDWTQEGEWYTFRKRSNDSSDVRSAMIRFLPAVPATKNGGEILTDLWKTAIPAEVPRAGGMVFRRYVGNNVPAWFIYGKGLEKGRDADSLFTLMIVNCGTHWQPLVIAQTYEDPGSFKTGIQMSASFSYGETADFAEVMLKTLNCPATSGKPLIDREGISGKFHYGNYSSMDYVNIYTGASSTSYVTYGGSLTLKPDGNFTYAYTSASSSGGGASFGKADGYGKYTIEGEYLVCRFTEHNQWVSSGGFPSKLKDSVYTYKIGGLTNFADGTKIAVLIQVPPNRPINAVTVGDSSNWFSTKKKD
ncbi:MAG TPA: DUF6683 family protein [Fimbriimonas sp.]|nr:DUF6683 family protein [Fimbriimonas sp.]